MKDKINISLIYPPFSTPTSVPFGLACLKGFLEKKDAGVKVSVFDFNLALYERFINAGKDCLPCYFCRKLNLSCFCKGIGADELNSLARGRKYFRNKSNFSDKQIYERHLRYFYSFFIEKIRKCCNRILKELLEFNPENILLKNFFQEEISRVKSRNPQLIGISLHNLVAGTFSFYPFALAKALKHYCRAPIIMGGASFSYVNPEDFLRVFDFIDYIIKGPGAESLYILAKNLNNGKIKEIPNLAYRKSGKILINESLKSGVKEFSCPDFSEFELKKYYNPQLVLPVMFSRGCSWGACVFCKYYGDHKGKPVFKRPDEFAEELGLLQKKYKACHFYIVDNCIPPDKLFKLARAILSKGLKINYIVYARPAKFSLKILKLLSRSGCKSIHWGVESASNRILKLMNKGTNIEEVERVLKNSSKSGIRNLIYMIFDFPLQKKEDYLKNLEFIQRLRDQVSFIGLHFFRLEKDTIMSGNPFKYNIRVGSKEKLFSLSGKRVNSSIYNISPLEEIVDPKNYQAEKLLFLAYVKKFSFPGYFEEHMFFTEKRKGHEVSKDKIN
ncbi:MAG: radical SAM protein [Candidatus Omnitrophica bacterium]|nr:radical SAM protein [Candidatus Omnitrophota bacterium]